MKWIKEAGEGPIENWVHVIVDDISYCVHKKSAEIQYEGTQPADLMTLLHDARHRKLLANRAGIIHKENGGWQSPTEAKWTINYGGKKLNIDWNGEIFSGSIGKKADIPMASPGQTLQELSQSQYGKSIEALTWDELSSLWHSLSDKAPAMAAKTPEAQEWISNKIKYLIEKEHKTPEQASGQAYEMARERGFDVPEKKAAKMDIDDSAMWSVMIKPEEGDDAQAILEVLKTIERTMSEYPAEINGEGNVQCLIDANSRDDANDKVAIALGDAGINISSKLICIIKQSAQDEKSKEDKPVADQKEDKKDSKEFKKPEFLKEKEDKPKAEFPKKEDKPKMDQPKKEEKKENKEEELEGDLEDILETLEKTMKDESLKGDPIIGPLGEIIKLLKKVLSEEPEKEQKKPEEKKDMKDFMPKAPKMEMPKAPKMEMPPKPKHEEKPKAPIMKAVPNPMSPPPPAPSGLPGMKPKSSLGNPWIIENHTGMQSGDRVWRKEMLGSLDFVGDDPGRIVAVAGDKVVVDWGDEVPTEENPAELVVVEKAANEESLFGGVSMGADISTEDMEISPIADDDTTQSDVEKILSGLSLKEMLAKSSGDKRTDSDIVHIASGMSGKFIANGTDGRCLVKLGDNEIMVWPFEICFTSER